MKLVKTLWQHQNRFGSFFVLLTVMVTLFLLWQYPLQPSDFINYIISARIFVVHHANPYVLEPINFSQDLFFTFAEWKNLVVGYGPVWIMLTIIPVFVFQNSITLTIMGMKILIASFTFGSAFLTAKIYQVLNKKRSLWLLYVLFLLSPIVLVEFIINGHNDIAMVFFILLWLWLAYKQKFSLAFVALWLGLLIKFIPIILLPLHFSYILWAQNGVHKLYTAIIKHFFMALGLTIIFYLPFWAGFQTLNGTLYLLSLGGLFQASPFLALLSIYFSYSAAKYIGIILFLMAYGFIIFKYQPKTFDKLIPAVIFVIISFMFLVQWYIMPWYLIWFIPLLVLKNSFWYQFGFYFINAFWILTIISKSLHLGFLLTASLFLFSLVIFQAFNFKVKSK